MNGREYFHESVVKDIVDVLTSMKDFDEVQFINNAKANRSFKSITSATKDLILTFPVMVSTDIEPDTAIMIAKAQEKKMASLLHILFTAISVDNNEDVFDYVKKFHSNMGSMGGTLDEYIDSMDRLATAYGEAYEQTMKIDHAVLNSILEDLKDSNHVLPSDVNEASLESYKIIPGYATGHDDMIIQEAFIDGVRTDYTPGPWNNRRPGQDEYHEYLNAFGLDASTDLSALRKTAGGYEGDINGKHYEFTASEYRGITDAQGRINRNQKNNNNSNARYTPVDTRRMHEKQKDLADYMSNMTKAHNAMVLNNEYKKANELQPTMMVVNFMKHSDESGDFINTAVIGIKCKIYAVVCSNKLYPCYY